MPENVEANGTEVSDAMSENEYDDTLKEEEEDRMAEQNTSPETGTEGSGEVKKKYDPKDPHRPRRKKARRACYACQRAHLTCGDERPCQRCIKRGLAEACQDGVRKKAKYLHDAPPEALRPVLGPNFNPNMVTKPTNGRHPSNATSESSVYGPPTTNTQSYPIFGAAQSQVPPIPEGMPFTGQPPPVTTSFQHQAHPRTSHIGNLQMPTPSSEINNFSSALFDPSNPAIFNFDLEALNFGSQYGAMEFGMLGHLSSGVAETPPQDGSLSQATSTDVNYSGGPMYSNGVNQLNHMYDNSLMDHYINADHNNNGMYAQGNLQQGLPHAYAIAAGPTPSSLASPTTDNTASPQASNLGFDASPTATGYVPKKAQPTKSKVKSSMEKSRFKPQSILGKRQRDPSSIYESVTEPHQYLTAFHNMITMVKRRFSTGKTLRIAKSFASIRPALIACTGHLKRPDLIFMEKAFQRTLVEYEDFMMMQPSPTIVCRRTGEIAAVNKEFIALTGWTKNVLLGEEPNLNVNTGESSTNGSTTPANKSGLATPNVKLPSSEALNEAEDKALRPVFVAELMDDDSVVQFYEDYSQLAFGDSRGHVQRKCRLFKYRTKEMTESISTNTSTPKDHRNSILSNRVTRIDGEHGISRLAKDGKLDCLFSWSIKRDTFDMPMMIIMNFLPCYYAKQDQLVI